MKMWAYLMHLSQNMWGDEKKEMNFDEEVYRDILLKMQENKFDTLFLDVGDAMVYKRHPEISIRGAWTYEKIHEEIEYAKALGIQIIPKVNFSATHDIWLGEYSRMLSTDIYYKVCRDIIEEIYEAFDKPKFIHIGFDEEDARMGSVLDYMVVRRNDILWHDVKYMLDCVKKTGAHPMMWADLLLEQPEEFKKHIKPDDAILFPWQYVALYEKHYTPITNCERDYNYYTTGIFKNSGIRYVEEDPMVRHYMEQTIPATKDGYILVPTVSDYNKHKYNMPDTLKWFETQADNDKIMGYLVAPWVFTTKSDHAQLLRDMEIMTEARKKYYDM